MHKSPTPIIVGTRGSALALVQATATEAALAHAFPGREFVRKVITTTGDRRTDVALAEVAKAEGTFDKGVFIKEIEEVYLYDIDTLEQLAEEGRTRRQLQIEQCERIIDLELEKQILPGT